MKICFICSEYPPGPHGGIGTMTQVLSRSLSDAGHEVSTIGVYPEKYPGNDDDSDGNIRIRRVRDSGGRFRWAWLRMRLYREVAEQVRRGAIDVVEAPDYQGWVAGWKALPAPLVVRLHGSETYFAAELGRRVNQMAFRLERASLRRADAWFSVCRYTADKTRALFRLGTQASAILYNPVEIPSLPDHSIRSAKRVVFSGTLTPKKGVISLIRAWPRVVAASPGSELHVYGKDGRTQTGGSMRMFLEEQLGAAHGSVHFHGHVGREKLFEAFLGARAAVFPSYAEAFAVAPLESMACECPTIYSRRGSGPELLTDGKQGLLVDPDKPEEIASAIVRVLGDDNFARHLGQAARAHVIEKFSTRTLVRQNVDAYEQVLQQFHAAQRPHTAIAI